MKTRIFLHGLIGFLIVAFGQPTFSPLLGVVSALIGYCLFWRAVGVYPFRRQKFWRGTLWYGAVTLVQLSWMTAIEYQGIYILFVWVCLSIFIGMQFGLLTLLIPYNRSLSFPRILAIAGLWTFFEWGRFYFLCGYSWNLSGLALSHLYSIQFASIFGVLGLSFWVIFVNLLGLLAIKRKKIPLYGLWLSAGAFPFLFGLVHLNYQQKKIELHSPQKIRCAMVQTGLLPPQKVLLQGLQGAFISPYDQWERILKMVAEKKGEEIDLIILPEAVVPLRSVARLYDCKKVNTIFEKVLGKNLPLRFMQEERMSNLDWAQGLADILNADVVVGLDHFDGKGLSYNSAFFLTPGQIKTSRYDKRVLMPLAEYLPFDWLAPLVRPYGVSGGFTHGTSPLVFEGKVPFAPLICYEETFPHKVREGRVRGAEFLVNLTNDNWYPNSRLPSQHFEHARFRAIENGVPLVRACNTGISGAIDGLGRTITSLPERNKRGEFLSGALIADVPLYSYQTGYKLWGNWGILIVSGLSIFIFIVFRRSMRW